MTATAADTTPALDAAVRAATPAAHTGLGRILQTQLRIATAAEPPPGGVAPVEPDLEPIVALPESIWVVPSYLPRPMAQGGPPVSSAVLGQMGNDPATYQIWDAYGDCLCKISWAPPVTWAWPKNGAAPIEVWRLKLTREYQEIMWAVAQKMDAAFLRPIFDRYNPRSTLAAREKHDAEESAREAKARHAADRQTADRVAEDELRTRHNKDLKTIKAAHSAERQAAAILQVALGAQLEEERHAHQTAYELITKLEDILVHRGSDLQAITARLEEERRGHQAARDRIAELEAQQNDAAAASLAKQHASLAKQRAALKAARDAFDTQRDEDMAMQVKRHDELSWQHKCVTAELKVNTLRLQAAVDKETNIKTAAHLKLEATVRRIAHKMCGDPAVRADYAADLFAAVD